MIHILKRITGLMFIFITLGLFYSCNESSKNTANTEDPEKEAGYRLFTILMTPDSLRSTEDKTYLQQIEAFVYEGCTVKNGRLEITVGKEDLKERGLSEIHYNVLKKDVEGINTYLDTISSPSSKEIFEESIAKFMKSREEYLAKKIRENGSTVAAEPIKERRTL
jgi:hypothetical protein